MFLFKRPETQENIKLPVTTDNLDMSLAAMTVFMLL